MANFANSSSSLPISRFHSAIRSSVAASFPFTRMCDARQMRRSVSCVSFSFTVSRKPNSVATSCLARGWRYGEALSGVGSCSAAAAPDAQSKTASRKIMPTGARESRQGVVISASFRSAAQTRCKIWTTAEKPGKSALGTHFITWTRAKLLRRHQGGEAETAMIVSFSAFSRTGCSLTPWSDSPRLIASVFCSVIGSERTPAHFCLPKRGHFRIHGHFQETKRRSGSR